MTYSVWRRQRGQAAWGVLADVLDLTYVDEHALEGGATYEYEVTANLE